MRSTPARKKVYQYLGQALPGLFDRFRTEWEDDGGALLPSGGVLMGQMEYEQEDPTGTKVYLVPQEVKRIDHRLPLIAVTSTIAQPWVPSEHVDALTEEFSGNHQLQVYCWTATPDWMDVVDAIEALAGCVAYALAVDQSLGDASDGIRLDPTTISISYSEVTPHGGDGALAGAAIAFVVTSQDVVSVEASGIVNSTEVTVHPALEG